MNSRLIFPPSLVPAISLLLLTWAAPARAQEMTIPAQPNWMDRLDGAFGDYVVTPIANVLFYDFGTNARWGTAIPFVLVWLVAGAIFFTLRMQFINVRGFVHAIRLTKGDYDDPHDAGEVSHFQALSSALSGTLGLGNIAGVAIAVAAGGPGAIFWLIVAGLLGMSSKFTECTLGQMYRRIDPSGVVGGGPMYYLRDGLAELGLKPLGIVMSILFAIMCMGGAVGGGCAFQASQSLNAVRANIPFFHEQPWVYGLVMAVVVGLVIIGGIRRIASAAEKIVPFMCALYMMAALAIIAMNFSHVGPAMVAIVNGAFSPDAIYGGVLGVMVQGFRRAAFSNEAGIGSASIAHSAARTDEPVREGFVALLEPFIDTVVVCTITGLVIVITGVYAVEGVSHYDGSQLTVMAFATVSRWFPWLLTGIIVLFAYSTMITWAYYGERCWSFLFGKRTALIFNLIFLGFVFLGSVVTPKNVLDFSDLMIFSMAIPNLIGAVLLSGKVKRSLDEYWQRYRAGEFAPTSRERSLATARDH
jgi:AGCS family alanine or glycine:cation symporter